MVVYSQGESPMPRKDKIHDAVKNALIKDGWTITDDPYRIIFGDADVYADFRIVKAGTETILTRALVIEIKGFTGDSPLHNLENALGQYEVYRIYLKSIAPEDKLYLAISSAIYKKQFVRPAFAIIVQEKQLPLLIVDLEHEEVIEWIN